MSICYSEIACTKKGLKDTDQCAQTHAVRLLQSHEELCVCRQRLKQKREIKSIWDWAKRKQTQTYPSGCQRLAAPWQAVLYTRNLSSFAYFYLLLKRKTDYFTLSCILMVLDTFAMYVRPATIKPVMAKIKSCADCELVQVVLFLLRTPTTAPPNLILWIGQLDIIIIIYVRMKIRPRSN